MLRTRNQELYAALMEFTKSIFDFWVEYDGQISVGDQPFWEQTPQGDFYTKSFRVKEYRLALHYLQHVVVASETYKSAVNAINRDSIWSKHVGVSIGTIYSAFCYDEYMLLTTPALWMKTKEQCDQFIAVVFDKYVEAIERFFIEDRFELEKLTPIYGVEIENTIELREGLSLIKLENEIIKDLLSNVALDDATAFLGNNQHVHNIFVPKVAVRQVWSIEKQVSVMNTGVEKIRKLEEKQSKELIELLGTISLVCKVPVRQVCALTKQSSAASLLGVRYFRYPGHSHRFSPVKPSQDDMALIKQVFCCLEKADGDTKHLNIATRRYYSSLTRLSMDDRIIDLMICAEAVFLERDDSEKTYKLAHRAGAFLGNTPADRKEIYKVFKKAYSYRSNFVHGGKMIASLTPIEAEELVDVYKRISQLLRDVLVKLFIQHHDSESKQKIDWDEYLYT